jgi:hypothetical protein
MLLVIAVFSFLIYLTKDRRINPVLSFSVPKIFYLFLLAFVIGTLPFTKHIPSSHCACFPTHSVRLVLCYLTTYDKTPRSAIFRYILHRFYPVLLATSFTVVLFLWYEKILHLNLSSIRAFAFLCGWYLSLFLSLSLSLSLS